jgi:hypothetical protein
MPFGPHRGACPAGRAALCQSVLVQNYAASALAVTRFNHRQIHSDRVARQRHSVRQVPRLEQSRNPGPEMEPFTPGHNDICWRSRQGAKESRWIGQRPSVSIPARCSGAA